ncbi:type II secretory pathway protein [Alteromonas sp. ASW11-36]|uniref:Type II secretory pathway protein n=1 Tax=Alteromonas arenosi TaxID=3055817 RepID=A0ABT7SSG1_9ALTE|nr:type II secretory pathway protein [Alteromonas sp. ASW11-36]MDM7859135.1 type II secretory pathway protein [Alteromonas sp. ASW11-36]
MLIISLFVILVLALLGIAMTRMLAATSQATVIEVSGLRALTAAQTGAQVLLQQTFPLNSPIQVCSTTITSPASFSNIEGLAGCSYIATCTTESVDKNGVANNYYRFSSIGQCIVGEVVVSRQVSLDAMQEQP